MGTVGNFIVTVIVIDREQMKVTVIVIDRKVIDNDILLFYYRLIFFKKKVHSNKS